MASQHTSDYPTLGEVLRLPAFAGCTVCGGVRHPFGVSAYPVADTGGRTGITAALLAA